MKRDVFIILHNLRSAYNVGSIFRTADAAGISKICLTGYTPAPVDRFGRERGDIRKTALGAEKAVSWEYIQSVSVAIKKLRREGFFIVAVEQAPGARDYRKITIKYPAAFLFGNEVRGLSRALLKKCDVVVEIPMKGKKESLNVSVAAGIIFFSVLGP